MPNEVDHLVALFEEKLGVDLVTPTEDPFWHTGNPTQLDKEARAARPWDFVERGGRAGGGRRHERPMSRRESWLSTCGGT